MRVVDDVGPDARGLRYSGTMGPPAYLGPVRLASLLRQALPTGRAIMAGLDSLRPEDGLTGPQFSLHPESQLSGDHRFATRFFPWRKGRCRRGDSKPLDAGWQLEPSLAGHLCRRCRNFSLAAGRAEAG